MNRPCTPLDTSPTRAADCRPYGWYCRDRRPRRSVAAVSMGGEPLSHGVAVPAPLKGSRAGSDGSTAGGGRSDLSEWQRSTIEEGVSRRREGRAPQQDDIRPYGDIVGTAVLGGPGLRYRWVANPSVTALPCQLP